MPGQYSLLYALFISSFALSLSGAPPAALRTGVAGHAFDHLGGIGSQADAAAASGDNIIYCSGVGVWGYQGLPEDTAFAKERKELAAYTGKAKAEGIRLAIGYVCATSIVRLDSFDRHWSAKFRSQFNTPPAEWRQQDKNGEPLPSWYGGDYQPACMNNPDWRAYEKFIVRSELESGCDGIFFDNPTVHEQGCYCPFCLEKFGSFLAAKQTVAGGKRTVEALRKLALAHPREFMEFRSTTARDFIFAMRKYARTVKRDALITCNNSLNSTDVLFAQCRSVAYDINELSKAEDFVVVEDMSSQPRVLGNGQTLEYGPTYKQLHAISHGKPIVAVNLADADYHTAPDLMKLAMAEAAANDASYLSWPTWPENVRERMAAAVRSEAEFLRQNEKLLNGTSPRGDVALFLCFRRWLDTSQCAVSGLAATLTRENIQYAVYSEEDFEKLTARRNGKSPVLLLDSFSILRDDEKPAVRKFQDSGGRVVAADEPGWLGRLKHQIEKPSVTLQGPATVRCIVRDQRNRTIVHLYNLNVEKVSSFEDKVHPAENIQVTVRVPFRRIHSVKGLTADSNGASLEVNPQVEGDGAVAVIQVPRLEIETILVIE